MLARRLSQEAFNCQCVCGVRNISENMLNTYDTHSAQQYPRKLMSSSKQKRMRKSTYCFDTCWATLHPFAICNSPHPSCSLLPCPVVPCCSAHPPRCRVAFDLVLPCLAALACFRAPLACSTALSWLLPCLLAVLPCCSTAFGFPLLPCLRCLDALLGYLVLPLLALLMSCCMSLCARDTCFTIQLVNS